jgi:hypothetical protein
VRRGLKFLALYALALALMGQAGPCAVGERGGDSAEDTRQDDRRKERRQKIRRFSGNGAKNLGTIKLTRRAIVKWKHRPRDAEVRSFSIHDDDNDISVDSEARRGRLALDKGTYRDVEVDGDGYWIIRIIMKRRTQR